MTTQTVDPQSFGHLAASYERLGKLTGNPFGPLLQSVLPVLGRRAVDLGCGTGRNTVD
jgi:trans-aconitate methyltransferase